MKKISLIYLIIFFLTVFSLSLSSVSFVQAEALTETVDPSAEAILDETVTEEDLGVGRARILPDSPLYALKRMGRDLRRVFTFDNAKKIDLDIRDANQELIDLKRVLDKKGEGASATVLDGFDRVEKRLGGIVGQLSALTNKERIPNTVAERLLDSEIKRQKLFEYIENKTEDERVLDRVLQIRNRSMGQIGEVFGRVQTDPELFDKVLQNQKGSEFKDLRNLEVLKRIEEKVPEEARDAIQRAQENAFKRIKVQAIAFNDEKWKRLDSYMQDFAGDQIIRFDILDKLDQNFGENEIPKEGKIFIRNARDFSARSFQDEFEKVGGLVKDETRLANIRENMMERFNPKEKDEKSEFKPGFVDDMSDRFELIAKFRSNIGSQELQKQMDGVEEEQVDSFVRAFPDARQDAEKAKEAMAQLRISAANGDFKKVKMLEKVVDKMKDTNMNNPDKRFFMEQMELVEKTAEQALAEHITKNPEKSFNAIVSENPNNIQFLKKLKENLEKKGLIPVPEGFDPGPVGRATPGSDLERRGLIPVPEGVDRTPNSGSRLGTSELEKKGLIPVPEGFDPGPVGRATPGSDLERRGLIPVPEGVDSRSIKDTGPGGNPTPSPTPAPTPAPRSLGNDLEKQGLIPVPLGDTAPGGNTGPTPAPVVAPVTKRVEPAPTRSSAPQPSRSR